MRVAAPDGIAAAESLATKAVVANEIDGYVVLDAQHAARRARALRGSQRGHRRRRHATARDGIRQSTLAQRLERANLSPALVDSLARSRLLLESEGLTEHGRGSDASRRANLAFAAAVAFLLYMSMILLRTGCPSRRSRGEVDACRRVVVSSVSPETLLAGKVIGVERSDSRSSHLGRRRRCTSAPSWRRCSTEWPHPAARRE